MFGFTRTEKKYVKMTDDDICNRKIEFKSKSEKMKKNRNYKKVGKTFWRVLECREIVALRDFLYKVWFVYNLAFESLFSQKIRIWKLFFRLVENYFSGKLLCLTWKTALLSITKFLLSISASLVGNAGFSLKHGNMWLIFQQSKIKIINQFHNSS